MKNHKLFWGSSYDRGIQHLLKMWPTIRASYPDATLDVAYGWDLFDRGYANNPERMAWKERISKEMQQPGITHHGRVGKDKLKEIREKCGIWAYPTEFFEINCITALESQRDGLVPVVINLGALNETVQTGVKVEGDIYDDETKDAYLKALLDMMGDQKKWEAESEKAKAFAKEYTWNNISNNWIYYIKK
jgi:glycosyltransferase involved in cell wall biosynthesis